MFAVLPLLAQAAVNPPASLPANPPFPATGPEILAAAGIMLVVAALTQVVAYWLVSKILVNGNSDFTNALKLWGTILAAVFGAGALTGVVIACGTIAGLGWVKIVALIGFVVLTVYVSLATTMKVYQINLLLAVVFMLLAYVIETIVHFSALQVLPNLLKGTGTAAALTAFKNHDPAVRSAGLAWLRTVAPDPGNDENDPRVAADRTKPVAERQAALQRMREKLEARRVALNPKDRAAVMAYKKDAQEYSQWYHEVEAQAANPAAKR